MNSFYHFNVLSCIFSFFRLAEPSSGKLLVCRNIINHKTNFEQNIILSLDGSNNRKKKKYPEIHCRDSNKFIIMHVLTLMFYIKFYKNKFDPNHLNSIYF